MQVAIRAIGNSKGVVLPKPVLAQTGLLDTGSAEMTVENGAIVLRPPVAAARAGWAEAARAVAERRDDALVLGASSHASAGESAW
jgi:antitoxin MazE